MVWETAFEVRVIWEMKRKAPRSVDPRKALKEKKCCMWELVSSGEEE